MATAHASAGRLAVRARGIDVASGGAGPAAGRSAVTHERMRKPVALAILSSDALSSVAYGPEAMLAVLALAGSSALGLSLGSRWRSSC